MIQKLLPCIFGLMQLVSNAQIAVNADWFLKLESDPIEIPTGISASGFTVPFSIVEVKDARTDTTSIGYKYFKRKAKIRKVIMKNGVTAALGRYMANYLNIAHKEQNNKGLVVILKKLRIGYEISLQIEFYYREAESCYPLYRFDSAFSFSTTYSTVEDLLALTINQSLEKLKKIDFQLAAAKGKKISIEEIEASLKRRLDLPILAPHVLFKKGAYRNFAEFISNAPSIQDFHIEKHDLNEMMYISEQGKEYATTKIWGYCDGTDIFIYSAHNFFPLYRTSKTFSFRGYKDLDETFRTDHSQTPLNSQSTSPPQIRVYKKSYDLFQIDIENGKFY